MPFLTCLVIGLLSLLQGIRVRLLDSKDGVATEQAVGMNMGSFLNGAPALFCVCLLLLTYCRSSAKTSTPGGEDKTAPKA